MWDLPNRDTNGRSWRARAACRDLPSELFFVGRGQSVAEAKTVCNGDPAAGVAACPVRAQCLEFGLRDRYGVYGGLSERERRIERRRREAAVPARLLRRCDVCGTRFEPSAAGERACSPGCEVEQLVAVLRAAYDEHIAEAG